jgi:phosphomannomutase/phosphoglucomutase
MKLFGSSGTRGVVGESLTPEFVLRVAKAAGTVWNAERVAIARDTRTTGEMFVNAAASGLASVGVDVDDLGVVPTPAAVRYCETESVPGVVITASHNPPEFNGVKLVGDDGVELSVEELERIEDHILTEEFDVAAWDEVGRCRTVQSTNDDYLRDLLDSVDREAIAEANLTVALDTGHGAGSLVTPDFLRELGCEVRTVNAQPDGHFPGRESEPVPENLHDLERLVRATGADVGIAHDGDADRAVFVDEHGNSISGEASLAALAADVLEPGDATVSAVNVSQRLVDVCDEVGAELELTPIGATNIITRIRELWREGKNVPIAGEGNGGIFFPNYRLVRDGAYIAAKFLELVAEQPASEVVGPYQDYFNVRINLEYSEEAALTAMLSAADEYAAAADAKPNTTDGHRLDYGDAWVLVRPSGTEPKVRVYAEAQTEARAAELAEDAAAALRAAVDDV